MRLEIIIPLVVKEFKSLFRDKTFWTLYLIPFLMLYLFGGGIKLTVDKVSLGIVDYSQKLKPLEFIENLKHNPHFEVRLYGDPQTAFKKMVEGESEAVVVIPPDFEREEFSEIGVFIDASYPFRGSSVEDFLLMSLAGEIPPPKIGVNPRFLFNENLENAKAVVPGLFAMLLLVVPAMLSSLLIVKEKEEGNIFNFYNSDITKVEYVVSKALPPFLIYSAIFPFLLAFGVFYFKTGFEGNLLLYWVASEIYILFAVLLGLLVSAWAGSSVTALVVSAIITVIPSFLYSGTYIPISSFEGYGKFEATLFPVYYYSKIAYLNFLTEGGGSEYLLRLLLYPVPVFILLLYLLKKEVK